VTLRHAIFYRPSQHGEADHSHSFPAPHSHAASHALPAASRGASDRQSVLDEPDADDCRGLAGPACSSAHPEAFLKASLHARSATSSACLPVGSAQLHHIALPHKESQPRRSQLDGMQLEGALASPLTQRIPCDKRLSVPDRLRLPPLSDRVVAADGFSNEGGARGPRCEPSCSPRPLTKATPDALDALDARSVPPCPTEHSEGPSERELSV
jgi:hypothetical protein